MTNRIAMAFFAMILVTPAHLVAFADDNAAPGTVAEALRKMESVLGKFDSDNQIEWRIPQKSVFSPDPKLFIEFDGMDVISHPFATPESVSFDIIMQWKRRVYDVDDQGKKTLKRTQASHNVTRYTVRKVADIWCVEGTMLSNGIHSSIGSTTFKGVVRWHSDGFEFVGNSGGDRYYAPGGTFRPGISRLSVKYSRKNDQLTVKTHSQPFELLKDSDGNVTLAPDPGKPFGKPFEQEATSEPVTGP